MKDLAASSTTIGTPGEEVLGEEVMNLGFGVLRCSVVDTRIQVLVG